MSDRLRGGIKGDRLSLLESERQARAERATPLGRFMQDAVSLLLLLPMMLAELAVILLAAALLPAWLLFELLLLLGVPYAAGALSFGAILVVAFWLLFREWCEWRVKYCVWCGLPPGWLTNGWLGKRYGYQHHGASRQQTEEQALARKRAFKERMAVGRAKRSAADQPKR
ncbi:MAG: hypothetical protein WD273_09415 [Trueperaceae bacterium]